MKKKNRQQRRLELKHEYGRASAVSYQSNGKETVLMLFCVIDNERK